MARQRRTYTSEFKTDAVKLITEKGYSFKEASDSLDVSQSLLEEGAGPPRGVRHAGRGAGEHLRVRRGLLQQAEAPLVAGLRVPGGLRGQPG